MNSATAVILSTMTYVHVCLVLSVINSLLSPAVGRFKLRNFTLHVRGIFLFAQCFKVVVVVIASKLRWKRYVYCS